MRYLRSWRSCDGCGVARRDYFRAPARIPLIVSGAVVAAGLFVAAIIVGYAAAPRDFYIAGGNPDALRDWSWQGTGWCSEVEMLDATAQRYARSIAENRENLERGSRRVRLALLVGCAAPTLGVAVSPLCTSLERHFRLGFGRRWRRWRRLGRLRRLLFLSQSCRSHHPLSGSRVMLSGKRQPVFEHQGVWRHGRIRTSNGR